MQQAIDKLLSISSGPIRDLMAGAEFLDGWGSLGRELAEMLRRRNGFYAYESALLVRPLQSDRPSLGVVEWNTPELWKAEFDEDLHDVLFFAEDIFGCQFCIRGDQISSFDPETALFEPMSSSLDSWASEVMSDYCLHTGFELAHAWQDRNMSLLRGVRLLPNLPFVCGGKFEVENLQAIDDVQGMSFRALLSNKTRDLPEGGTIIFTVE